MLQTMCLLHLHLKAPLWWQIQWYCIQYFLNLSETDNLTVMPITLTGQVCGRMKVGRIWTFLPNVLFPFFTTTSVTLWMYNWNCVPLSQFGQIILHPPTISFAVTVKWPSAFHKLAIRRLPEANHWAWNAYLHNLGTSVCVLLWGCVVLFISAS